MLEVHPPHETPHTWRDFFIHIATIVVGLLIAVALEQSVEWLHHRAEIAETRATLERERALNARISGVLLEEFRRITPRLRGDQATFSYLHDHPGAPASDWPAPISWASLSITYLHSGWDTAQQGGTLPLMPRREVRRYNEVYARLSGANEAYGTFGDALHKAELYAFHSGQPSTMSPAQIDAELALIDQVLAAHVAHGQVALAMKSRFPDFQAPTSEELMSFTPRISSDADRAATRRLFERVQAIKDEAD